MIFGNPVNGTIHTPGWSRPAGNIDFKVTQVYGCTGVEAEPAYLGCPHFHRGIDLGNGRGGDPVIAVESGVVTLAGADALSGNALRVWIEHPGGWFSGYYHLHDFGVKAGQQVVKGQLLGHVGKTGWATDNHLHFEVHASSDRLSFFDPWPHLAQNVTIRPKGDGINLRLDVGGTIYAETKIDGEIHRASDNVDLGATATWRKWGGIFTGPQYTVPAGTSTRWEKLALDGKYVSIASLLATRSIS